MPRYDVGTGETRTPTNVLDQVLGLIKPARDEKPIASWSIPKQPEQRYRPVYDQRPTEWELANSGALGNVNMEGPGWRSKYENGQHWVSDPDWQQKAKAYDEQYLMPASQKDTAKYNDRIERMKALGLVDELGMKTGALSTVELPGEDRMKFENYADLPTTSRGLVDTNTVLFRAAQQDKADQAKYGKLSPETKATYDKKVEDILGKGRGSDTYAPQTLAAIEQLGLGGNGADLDDFLGLKAAGTRGDLQQMERNLDIGADAPDNLVGGTTLSPTAAPVQTNAARVKLHRQLSEAAQSLASKTLSQTSPDGTKDKLNYSFSESAAKLRAALVEDLGGTSVDQVPEAVNKDLYGFGRDTSKDGWDEFFKKAYADLTNISEEGWKPGMGALKNAIQQAAKAEDKDPTEMFNAFYNFLDIRTNNDMLYGVSRGTAGQKPFQPKRFRETLGIGVNDGG